MRGKLFLFLVEVFWDFGVKRFHFLRVLVSEYIGVRFVNYLKKLLVFNIFLMIVILGMKNA